jgi:peptide/nickel transport system permease protein
VGGIVFFLARLTGNPVALLLSESSTLEDKELITRQLGLDKPLSEQYFIFVTNALRGDFGRSVRGDRSPAFKLVADRLPASLQLAGVTFLVSLLIGLPLGVITGVRKGSWLDLLIRIFTLIGQSAPVFWIGIVGMYVLSVQYALLPTSGYGKPEQFVLPVLSLCSFTVAAIVRLTRNSMIDAMESEYIKLARIKGLSETIVVWKHALRNSLLPVLTYSGILLGRLIAGVVVVETVFAWPGMGRLAYEAVLTRDFPVLQTVVIVIAALFLFLSLAVDILYAYIEPRIRYA